MQLRTDRLGLLLDQFVISRDIARERVKGMTDDEYLWEPVPGCWSIRRRTKATPHAIGGGEWVLERVHPEPTPPPLTTIAWRLSHLYLSFTLRWEWAFGGRSMLEDGVEFTPSTAEAFDRFWALTYRWRQSLEALTDAELDQVGFSQYPRGLDPQLPFIATVWWTNRELIQHTSEIALLRDLYAFRQAG
jgi:hypothetical protein